MVLGHTLLLLETSAYGPGDVALLNFNVLPQNDLRGGALPVAYGVFLGTSWRF
ncbi:hypothetical protein PR003_g20154 [Phytophthora rubi]|uniref:Uncharacterized protein n=1 Tax=Phytophthora rubi TaxID=129364 RepID=A0A6A4DPQ6_9STRA|nr:hypothetical protein PR001_g19135 [Phytophthora rubi]KAE9310927.1 hypothetical protein PR003_g20154 [Phytophthora rubi]